MSRTPHLIVVCIVLTISGCVHAPANSPSTVTPQDSDVTATVTTTTTDSTPTTNTESTVASETSTPEPVGTSDLPHDLRIRNSRGQEVTLQTMVTANESGAVIFNKTVPLERDEFRKFEVDFPAVGNYTITTTDADGEVYQYVWTVERLPPSFEIIVTAERRGNVSYLKSSA